MSEGKGHAQRQADDEAKPEVERDIGRGGQNRNFAPVDDRGLRRTDAACHADLVVACKQRIIERAVGIEFALQHVVLDRALTLIEDGCAQLPHLGPERTFFGQGRLVFRVERARSVARFSADGLVQRAYPGTQADHLRVIVAERGGLLLVFGFEPRLLLAQRGGALIDFRDRGRLPEALFCSDPFLLCLRQRAVERHQRSAGQAVRIRLVSGRAAAGIDDIVRLGVCHQIALRLIQLDADGGEALLQELACHRRCLKPAVERRGQESVRKAVDDPGGSGRVFRGIAQFDQPAGADRLHFDAF